MQGGDDHGQKHVHRCRKHVSTYQPIPLRAAQPESVWLVSERVSEQCASMTSAWKAEEDAETAKNGKSKTSSREVSVLCLAGAAASLARLRCTASLCVFSHLLPPTAAQRLPPAPPFISRVAAAEFSRTKGKGFSI